MYYTADFVLPGDYWMTRDHKSWIFMLLLDSINHVNMNADNTVFLTLLGLEDSENEQGRRARSLLLKVFPGASISEYATREFQGGGEGGYHFRILLLKGFPEGVRGVTT